MEKVALIVAGGQGKRMNSDILKQFLILNDFPVLMSTIRKFSHFDKIFLVLPYSQFKYWKVLCQEYSFKINVHLVRGGETRFHSVKNGLNAISKNTIIAIHDGVRPLVSTQLINTLISKTKKGIGVVPILPLKDSIREIKKNISFSIEREKFHSVQTPQCFLGSDIKEAYKQKFSALFTDDATVFEKFGGKIESILGEEKNIKITTKNDLSIAKIFMQ